MGDKNLLVLLLDERADPSDLRREVARRPGDVHVRLVAPAHVGALAWYTTDEEPAHAEASEQARRTARRLVSAADVEAATDGEADPVLAVEDALAEFPADEILIAGGDAVDSAVAADLERFGLPLTRLGPPTSERGSRLRAFGRGVMSGRSAATPYAVALGVVAVMAAIAALLIAVGVLVLWLA